MKKEYGLLHLPDKKTPKYFRSGTLVFEKSGHVLTRDKQYYVCSKKQKSNCSLDEKRIKAEVLERNFSRFANKFSIKKEYETDTMKSCFVKPFKQMLDFVVEEKLNKEEEDRFILIVGILIGISLIFLRESEYEKGRSLAFLCKKIFLADSGKILRIELSSTGEYIIKYLASNIWGYKNNLPYKFLSGFKISPYEDVEKELRIQELKEISQYDPFVSGYIMMSTINNIFSGVLRINGVDIFKAAQNFDQMMLPSLIKNLKK